LLNYSYKLLQNARVFIVATSERGRFLGSAGVDANGVGEINIECFGVDREPIYSGAIFTATDRVDGGVGTA
jgi:hypothetical protein